MNVLFCICIVKCGVAGTRVWKVCLFRHADDVGVGLVCILSQLSILRYA